MSPPTPLQIHEKVDEFRLRFFASPSVTSLSTSTAQFLGAGINFGLQYSFQEHLAFETSFQQSFFTSTAAPFFSELDLRLIYSPGGHFVRRTKSVELSGFTIASQTEWKTEGFRFGLTAALVFFNSFSSIIPYTGFGGILYYEFSRPSLFLGIKKERLENGGLLLYPGQAFVGIFF